MNHRPEHPGVPLPAQCISKPRDEQRYYDADPEHYEREYEARKVREADEQEALLQW